MAGSISRQLVFASEISTDVYPDVLVTKDRSRFRNDGVNTNVVYQKSIGGVAGTSIGSGVFVHNFGGSSKIDCGSDFIKKSALTISMWIYPKAFTSGLGKLLDNGKAIAQIDSTNHCLNFTSDAVVAVSATNSIILLRSYHVVITRTAAGVVNFYINGLISGATNQASSSPVNGTTNVILGNRNATDRGFNGLWSMCKISTFPFTAGMALSDFESTRRNFGI